MIAQQGIKVKNGIPPIRYEWLEACFKQFHEHYPQPRLLSIHMPRIGCGLAGGKWELIESLIRKELVDRGYHVTVYEL